MFAFGLPAPEPKPQTRQEPAASNFDSGQLNMSAFGLPSPELPTRPAAISSAIDSGQLDMSAFGLPAPEPPSAMALHASVSASDQSSMPAHGTDRPLPSTGGAQRHSPSVASAQPAQQSQPQPQRPRAPLLSSSELAQLKESLGLGRDQSLLRLGDACGQRGPAGSQQQLHTAAALFAVSAAPEISDGQQHGKGDDAEGAVVPEAAPGLSVEETAAVLKIAELMLLDSTVG